MGYKVFRPEDRDFQVPPRGDQRRGRSSLCESLHSTRANIWRLPPGSRNARHIEHAQEEMFVVLEGTAAMLLGDPAERVELPRGSIAIVETETVLQLRNDSEAEVIVLAVGAPPEQGRSEHLPDVD